MCVGRGGERSVPSMGVWGVGCRRESWCVKQRMAEEKPQHRPWGLVVSEWLSSQTTAPLHHKHSEL